MLSDVCGGAPVVTGTRHEEYAPGVDSWFDIELEYPSGATASVVTTMLDERYHFTFRVFGTEGDVLVHNFLQPDIDDRVSVTAGGRTSVEHLGTKSSYTLSTRSVRRSSVRGLGAADRAGRRGSQHDDDRRGVHAFRPRGSADDHPVTKRLQPRFDSNRGCSREVLI